MTDERRDPQGPRFHHQFGGPATALGVVCVCVCATDDAMTEVLTSEDPFSGPSKAVGPVLSATLEVRDFIAPVRPSRQFGGPDTAVGVVFACLCVCPTDDRGSKPAKQFSKISERGPV